jgi:hypothetical protein
MVIGLFCVLATSIAAGEVRFPAGYYRVEEICSTLSAAGHPIACDEDCKDDVFAVFIPSVKDDALASALTADGRLELSDSGGKRKLKRSTSWIQKSRGSSQAMLNQLLGSTLSSYAIARRDLDEAFLLDANSAEMRIREWEAAPLGGPPEREVLRSYAVHKTSYADISLTSEVVKRMGAFWMADRPVLVKERFPLFAPPSVLQNGSGFFKRRTKPGDCTSVFLPEPRDTPETARIRVQLLATMRCRFRWSFEPLTRTTDWGLILETPFSSPVSGKLYVGLGEVIAAGGLIGASPDTAPTPAPSESKTPGIEAMFAGLGQAKVGEIKEFEGKNSLLLSDLLLVVAQKNQTPICFAVPSFANYEVALRPGSLAKDLWAGMLNNGNARSNMLKFAKLRLGAAPPCNDVTSRLRLSDSRVSSILVVQDRADDEEVFSYSPVLSTKTANARLQGKPVTQDELFEACLKLKRPPCGTCTSNEALTWCNPARLRPFAVLARDSARFRELLKSALEGGAEEKVHLSELEPAAVRSLAAALIDADAYSFASQPPLMLGVLAARHITNNDLVHVDLEVRLDKQAGSVSYKLYLNGEPIWSATANAGA